MKIWFSVAFIGLVFDFQKLIIVSETVRVEFYVILHLTDRDALKEISMVIKNHIAQQESLQNVGWKTSKKYLQKHTHTRLMALCQGLPRWAGTRTRKVKPIWILLKQEWVTVASVRSYASLHLAVDNHASSFLQAGGPPCRPTNSVKALKANIYKKNKRKTNTKQKSLQLLLQLKQTFII